MFVQRKKRKRLSPLVQILSAKKNFNSARNNVNLLNHKMPIEWGRFVGTLRDDRICETCFLNKTGDEFHYLLECSYFEDARRVHLPRNLLATSNVDTFRRIMCPEDTQRLFKVAKFCKVILKTFKEIFRNI